MGANCKFALAGYICTRVKLNFTKSVLVSEGQIILFYFNSFANILNLLGRPYCHSYSC